MQSWISFFRGIDRELAKECSIFWTMTNGREHRTRWAYNKHDKQWGITDPLPPIGSLRVSYASCIHQISNRTRFGKNCIHEWETVEEV